MTGLIQGDALHIPLADESVDLVVTSPPYWSLRSYRDDGEHFDGQLGSEPTPGDFLVALWAVMDELWRVLKPEGVCWVNLGDKRAGSGGHNNSNLAGNTSRSRTAADVHDSARATRRTAPDRYKQDLGGAVRKSKMGLPWRFALGCSLPEYRGLYDPGEHPLWLLSQDQVWAKPNHLPDSAGDRTQDAHEYWFMFAKRPKFFAAVDEIREPHAAKTLTHRGGGQTHGNHANPDNNYGSDNARRPDPLGRVPGSVWSVPSEPLVVPEWARERYDLPDHFAAFPTEWPRRLILGWSPNGICQACGQGRRPKVNKDHVGVAAIADTDKAHDPAQGNNFATRGKRSSVSAAITGYACACHDDSAPTTPAVVLDPFAGTGTAVMVARALGRTGIGIDLSASYLRLARWRVWESGGASRARERTNLEAQEALPL